VGLVREVNEDAFARFEPTEEHLLQRGCLYVVADGLGGHKAGDVASHLAAETILDVYFNSNDWRDPAQGLEMAIWQANHEIFRLAQGSPDLTSMGTTVVAAVILGDRLITANVGDSREYLFRSHLLDQLTIDHSWVSKAVEEGLLTPEQARTHPDRHVIYRSLGSEPDVDVDLFNHLLFPGDRILQCSDGLTDVVNDPEIAALLNEPDPEIAAQALVDLALSRGGPDNITISLVDVLPSGSVGASERPTPRRLPALGQAPSTGQPGRKGRAVATVPTGLPAQPGHDPSAGKEPARGRQWLQRVFRNRQ
jgi:protein phosphatase